MRFFTYFRNTKILENVISTNKIAIYNMYNCRYMTLAEKFDKHHDPVTESKNSSNISEEPFLVKLKSNPDKFGDFSPQEKLLEDDLKEEKYFTEQPLPSQKLRTKQYADIIKKLISQRKIKEAIDVVQVRMLKEDRIKPDNYIYNLLLGACGRVGYTKMAFMLYNEMKRRGLQVTGGTYTALFNTCANSPWPLTDGLSRAKNLRNLMIEKGYEPNDTNYNAMIKAFGRCGDHSTAFGLVDEMLSKGIRVKSDTINFLLQACISDKEAGFRHALLIWRKLIKKNIQPDIYTFNLLLRSIRDCGLGDVEVTKNVIDSICTDQKLLRGTSLPLLSSQKEDIKKADITSIQSTSNNSILNISTCRPNLLAEVPHLGNIVSLSEVTKPEDRLLLVGGCKTFLETLTKYGCKPDIKTFTQLLDCIPSTLTSEKELLATMKKFGIIPDIDFYNMLMKKRSMRFDYESAKEVLNLMKKRNYRPDLVTYGILSLGCRNKQEAMELIEHMKEKQYSFNAEILGAMLHQACHHSNFWYVLYIMEVCLTENVKPNKKFMEALENFYKESKKLYYEKVLKAELIKSFGIFRARYKTWNKEIQIDKTEDEHPWKQFRETSQGKHRYKPRDSARFKSRHISVFKVKTSTKLKNV